MNYDTPWNSTKPDATDRSRESNRHHRESIHIYNFYPTAQVNSQIELENKAKLKLFAFHSALGEDSGIYSPDEDSGNFRPFRSCD